MSLQRQAADAAAVDPRFPAHPRIVAAEVATQEKTGAGTELGLGLHQIDVRAQAARCVAVPGAESACVSAPPLIFAGGPEQVEGGLAGRLVVEIAAVEPVLFTAARIAFGVDHADTGTVPEIAFEADDTVLGGGCRGPIPRRNSLGPHGQQAEVPGAGPPGQAGAEAE